MIICRFILKYLQLGLSLKPGTQTVSVTGAISSCLLACVLAEEWAGLNLGARDPTQTSPVGGRDPAT